ncbi:hypothetical protein IRJ41_016415, partial [Triplophysa rosa]
QLGIRDKGTTVKYQTGQVMVDLDILVQPHHIVYISACGGVTVESKSMEGDDTLNKPIQLKVVKVLGNVTAAWCKNLQSQRKPFTVEVWFQKGMGVGCLPELL